MEKLKTKAAFARHCMVSRAAIASAINSGIVIATPEGKINLNNPINKYYALKNIENDKAKRAVKKTFEITAEDYFLLRLKELNSSNKVQTTQIGIIKNEVAFEIFGLFYMFNQWTEKKFDAEWLIDKSLKWVKSVDDAIDEIVDKSE